MTLFGGNVALLTAIDMHVHLEPNRTTMSMPQPKDTSAILEQRVTTKEWRTITALERSDS